MGPTVGNGFHPSGVGDVQSGPHEHQGELQRLLCGRHPREGLPDAVVYEERRRGQIRDARHQSAGAARGARLLRAPSQ